MRESADIRWGDVRLAYGVSVALTLALGGAVFVAVDQNVWWVALAGVVGLFVGGYLIGRRAGRRDALGGTMLAIVYFATVFAVIFGGALGDLLPDPLPGLPIGDSTFFFVWPLSQLAAAVLGALLGPWRPRLVARP